MAKFFRKFLIGLGKTLVALFLVFGLLLGYAAYSERSASGRAEAFCQTISAGSDASTLLRLAIAQGADTRQTRWVQDDAQDHLPVTFTGVTPMSRHICWIKAVKGRVVSARVAYLD
jgi:hypothetical protein